MFNKVISYQLYQYYIHSLKMQITPEMPFQQTPPSPIEQLLCELKIQDLNEEIYIVQKLDDDDYSYRNIQELLLDGQVLQNGEKNNKPIQKKIFMKKDNIQESQLMFLTNYRIIITSQKPNYIPISLPFGYINSAQVLQKQNKLRIELKTGITFEYKIQKDENKSFEQIIKKSQQFLPFCFNITSKMQIITYKAPQQIKRMKVTNQSYKILKNMSQQSKFCLTYPQYFIIPKNLQLCNLQKIKKCRYGSRIPVMTYYYQKKQVGLWRASKKKQVSSQIQQYDTSYLRQIPGTLTTIQLQQNSQNNRIYSFQSLQKLRIVYTNILKQYNLMYHGIASCNTDFFKKAIGKWYEQIDRIILSAFAIVQIIKKKNHVLVEEKYSLDRIPQVFTICQIILDPFYRTFKGLAILIQKQFISFGHPFVQRCGFNQNKLDQCSPIFIQLLECINQLIGAYPTCFEYSSTYLAKIGYEVYTTKCKNFIGFDDIKKQEKYHKCTSNIWNYQYRLKSYYNYQYREKETKKQLSQIRKMCGIKQYMIWREYYDLMCKMNGQQKIIDECQNKKQQQKLIQMFKNGDHKQQ